MDEAMSLPDMPALKCLRIISCALFEFEDVKAQFEQLRGLTRLELHHVHYQSDSFPQILQLCVPTLEHLVVLDVNGPNLASTMDDLQSFTSLKKLCVGPHVFPNYFPSYNLSTKFPPSLEELTLFELEQPLFSWWPFETVQNVIGLESLLKSCDGGTTLKHIHVRGFEDQWSGRGEMFSKLCQSVGIRFSLETFKGEFDVCIAVERL